MRERLASCGVSGLEIKDLGGPGLSLMDASAIEMTLAKYDASVATFFGVHNSLGMRCINELGDEEQRARMLPDAISLKAITCFGLTEPDYGSDAGSLKTTAKKVEGGYLINGHKRWIGNADFCKYCVVWARNEDEGGKIQAFVVENGTKGFIVNNI